MIYGTRKILGKARPGGWLPQDHVEIERWIQKLKKRATEQPQPFIKPIADLQQMVYSDPVLQGNVEAMFAEAFRLKKYTPSTGSPNHRPSKTSWYCSTRSCSRRPRPTRLEATRVCSQPV